MGSNAQQKEDDSGAEAHRPAAVPSDQEQPSNGEAGGGRGADVDVEPGAPDGGGDCYNYNNYYDASTANATADSATSNHQAILTACDQGVADEMGKTREEDDRLGKAHHAAASMEHANGKTGGNDDESATVSSVNGYCASTTDTAVCRSSATGLLLSPIDMPVRHRQVSQPGAYAIIGPGYVDDYDNDNNNNMFDNNNDNNNNGNGNALDDSEEVFEGYVPEPTPEELIRREVRHMINSAITLDDDAVRAIPSKPTAPPAASSDGCHGSDKGAAPPPPSPSEDDESSCLKSPACMLLLTLLFLLAIALGVTFGSGEPNSSSYVPSCARDVQDRYDITKSIIARISSPQDLNNATSPQSKALEWIVCWDRVSSNLIDNRDPDTDILPKQARGTIFGGDAGKAQVFRRYVLAVIFYATSEAGPWTEDYNFLSPDEHECSWHKKVKRTNFPFGDYDYPGMVCTNEELADYALMNDEEIVIADMNWNFRIPNNLTGIIPPEFGYLEDVTWISFENQKELRGSIPSTIGHMANLHSITINFSGPGFGGMVPPSLFTIPAVQYITFQFGEGVWRFPETIDDIMEGDNNGSSLVAISMGDNGLSGTMPSFLPAFKNLITLNLKGNALDGSVPDSLPTTIEFLNLQDNYLTGTLPEGLGQLTNLTVMAFGKNKIHGLLPSWCGNLGKLRLLDLSHNEFEGPIPRAFSQLSSLEHMSLQNNANLNGSISALEPLGALSTLMLYANSFTSTIPEGLFSNVSITKEIFADFGHNNFTGKLPQTLSERASNTTYLAIMKNNFDADAVDDVICEDVETLFADCSSCPCCKYCCDKDSPDESDRWCNFDLDFSNVVGLSCGPWWEFCSYTFYDPLPVEE